VNDTRSYRQFSFATLGDVVTSIRTPGYPLFLRGVELLSTSPRAVPVAQFTLFAAAVAIFYEALRGVTGGVWLPWLAAAALMSTNMLAGYVNTVATETVSAAVSVACGALLLFWVRSPRWPLLLALTAASAAGWLIRPNGVFLVVWIPFLGARIVAWRARYGAAGGVRIGPGMAFARLSLAVLAPLAVWVVMRWACCGHFGVACFDGYNKIGLVGQFVTPETTQTLSPDERRVVEAALLNRERRLREGGPFINEPALHYLRVEFHHDDTIWTEFVPPTRQIVGDSTLAINAFLSDLARRIIARQPDDYLIWLAKATRQAVRKLFSDTLQHPVSLGLLLGSVFLFLATPLPGRPQEDGVDSTSVVRLMATLAVSYAVFNLACTIPFVPPRERMTDAAALWGPALLAAWFGSLLERRVPDRPERT